MCQVTALLVMGAEYTQTTHRPKALSGLGHSTHWAVAVAVSVSVAVAVQDEYQPKGLSVPRAGYLPGKGSVWAGV